MGLTNLLHGSRGSTTHRHDLSFDVNVSVDVGKVGVGSDIGPAVGTLLVSDMAREVGVQ